MGSSRARTIGSSDPHVAPSTIWGKSGPGTQSCKAMLVSGKHARVMLQPQAWGAVQIRDTTWAHDWPVTGEGLLPRSHPAVRDVAEKGEAQVGGARMRCANCARPTCRLASYMHLLLLASLTSRSRLWPEGAPPLSRKELDATLLGEFEPMVGRGKKPVPGRPEADGATSWESARGKGRHSELAARFAVDQVQPLIQAEAPGPGELRSPPPPVGGSNPRYRDHVRELIRAELKPPTPTSPQRFHEHRAAIDHVSDLINA